MLTIWGRTTSSNVQKVMWGVSELGLAVNRIDAGGEFGRTKDADYLAMNPNSLVPTMVEDDGFVLWESNSILRYLGETQDKTNVLRPKDAKTRALASKWMDWQLSVAQPAFGAAFVGLVRTPEDKRNKDAIQTSLDKTGQAMAMLDAQLAKTRYLAGDEFSYGDIPASIIAYRYRRIHPGRPAMPNFDRWCEAIAKRKGFQDGVTSAPFK